MNSFLLLLTLCGTLSDSSKTSCEQFIIDSKQSELDCYKSIALVYNHDKADLYNIMADSGLMFKTVKVTKLACVQEDVE